MRPRVANTVYATEDPYASRTRRRLSARLLCAMLLLGAAAAILLAVLALRQPGDPARLQGLAAVAGALAAVVLVAALWHRRLFAAGESHHFVVHRSIEALRRRGDYEEAQAKLMERISDLIEVFTRTRNLEAVLSEAVRVLQASLGVSLLVLQLYEEEGGRFTLSIEEGGQGIDLGDDLRTDVIQHGRSRLINQLPADAHPTLVGAGYTALMVAPLGRGRRATDRSIGLIAALDRAGREFTGRELSLLAHFARHAGLIIENAQLYSRAEHLAQHDGLTDLFNHRAFVETLGTEIDRARRIDGPVSLIMADIDNFKRYNDAHGHPQGDRLLRHIARILRENTRQRDIVARYGGEEFVIILPVTGRYGARRVAESIRAAVERAPFEGEDKSGPVTITLGVAVFPEDAASAEQLIQRADDALYRGKSQGKNRVCWSSPPEPS